VRRAAHALGLRFRLHRKNLPGQPDLVFSKHRVTLFVHGCFWHRHLGCSKATMPKSRQEFWQGKFDRNVSRDQAVEANLTARGWRVETIWECETRDESALRARLVASFGLPADRAAD
jgi:DNA mismatch endonuclease (patch repair protein)